MNLISHEDLKEKNEWKEEREGGEVETKTRYKRRE